MKKQNLTIVTYPLVMIFFLLLLFVSTVEYAQGITCENIGIEGICVDLKFGLMNEDLKTPSEYDFSEPFPEGLYLALEKVTISNNPGIVGELENTSNLSLKIDVHPDGAEKIYVAKITVPPLKPNDIYEITYSCTGTNITYESKLNGKLVEIEEPYFRRNKLTTDGWWQIDFKIEPLNWSVDQLPSSYILIINGELQNYFLKVYSDYEINNLKLAEDNIEIARCNIILAGFILLISLISILLQHKRAGNQNKNLKELTEELKEIARGIKTLTEEQLDRKHEDTNSEKEKEG